MRTHTRIDLSHGEPIGKLDLEIFDASMVSVTPFPLLLPHAAGACGVCGAFSTFRHTG